MWGRGGLRHSIYGVGLSVLVASAAMGQETGGASASLSYSERLLSNDDGVTLQSGLGFAFESQTRTQSFTFEANTNLDKFGTQDTVVQDPSVALGYQIESRDTVLGFDVSFRRQDVDTFFLATEDNVETVQLDTVNRDTLDGGISLELGRDAPFGATAQLRYTDTSFEDSKATGLIDSLRLRGDLGLRFEINGQMTARLEYSYNDIDRDGGIDVERQRLAAGLAYQINAGLRADISLGQTQLDRGGSIADTSTSGLFYDLSIVQDRPNGQIEASLRSDIETSGSRVTARVDRNWELPRGALSLGFGLTQNEDEDDINPLYALSYTQDLPRAQFTLSVQQSYNSSSDGAQTLQSRVNMSFRQQLNTRADLQTGLSYIQLDPQATGTNSTDRINFNIDYSHALTDKWALTAGYRHQRSTDTNGAVDRDDTMFLGLRTQFDWRP